MRKSVLLLLLLHELLSKHSSALTSEQWHRRRFLAGCGCLLGPAIATLNPQNAIADTPAMLYPGGGGASFIRPYYEEGSWKPTNLVTTTLAKERIHAKELSPLSQIALPFSDPETYYPSYLFGAWNIKSTLKSKKYPFGTEVVQSNSLIEGSPRNRNEQVGNSSTYEVHYFSTLANTASNQMTVNLGLGVPKSKVIADRGFNAKSLSRGYKQLVPIEEVDWDYRKDPNQFTLLFGAGALAEDMRPLGQRRAEVYLTARASEEGFDSDTGEPTFCAAERSRTVTLAPGAVIVSDVESVTEFRKIDDNHITAVSRIAVYLTPNPNSREGALWQ
ncbi:expressed unknown protein [Seminavis robusta]|uniref:DUF6816 domain-containing protein n=1 Tax=Seminavis robusta TaxID=568900 RepID=A0A9N8E975_9STRA|nr:expressed unknown protein [Seminavis robusta]|eukprot:Sro827_g207880.1 n/a (331) ;mRNA; r:33979-34971